MNLTYTEQLVANCLPDGLANKEIARRLQTPEGTLKVHLKSIYVKLGVKNRTQAAIYVDRARTGR